MSKEERKSYTIPDNSYIIHRCLKTERLLRVRFLKCGVINPVISLRYNAFENA